MFLFGTAAVASGLPAPDPVAWKPASVAGPALFMAAPVAVEDFRNPPGMDYGCRVTPAHAKQSGCFSNACGLERITFKPAQVFAGTVPDPVSLNRVLGEWCTAISAPGRRFLVAILPDRHWSLFEVVEVQGQALAVPDFAGCLGDVDLKPLLPKQGIALAAAADRKRMAWRVEWHDEVPQGPCSQWISQDQFQKSLPLATVIDSWKNKHP